MHLSGHRFRLGALAAACLAVVFLTAAGYGSGGAAPRSTASPSPAPTQHIGVAKCGHQPSGGFGATNAAGFGAANCGHAVRDLRLAVSGPILPPGRGLGVTAYGCVVRHVAGHGWQPHPDAPYCFPRMAAASGFIYAVMTGDPPGDINGAEQPLGFVEARQASMWLYVQTTGSLLRVPMATSLGLDRYAPTKQIAAWRPTPQGWVRVDAGYSGAQDGLDIDDVNLVKKSFRLFLDAHTR